MKLLDVEKEKLLQAKDQNIMVVENFNFDAPKTKNFINVLKALELDNKKAPITVKNFIELIDKKILRPYNFPSCNF